MIVSKEFLRENKNFVNETKSPILVLDLKHFQYYNDVERFGFAVEVLNVVNSISWVNKICQNLNSDFQIDTAIYYEIMDCIFKEESLKRTSLFTYFKVQQDLQNLAKIFEKIAETDRNFDFPIAVDFMLLGVDLEKYHAITEDVKSDLHDDYADLFSKVKSNEIEISQFIFEAKELLSVINVSESELV